MISCLKLSTISIFVCISHGNHSLTSKTTSKFKNNIIWGDWKNISFYSLNNGVWEYEGEASPVSRI